MSHWACVALFLACSLAPTSARAQQQPSGNPDPESYALSADEAAQTSLGGFRGYLERIRRDDAQLYRALDPRLDALQERDLAADVIFWVTIGLSAAALIAAIPLYVERDAVGGRDPAIGLLIGGLGTLVLGVIVQALVRPTRGDLMALIDLHDQLVGRR